MSCTGSKSSVTRQGITKRVYRFDGGTRYGGVPVSGIDHELFTNDSLIISMIHLIM